MQHSADELTGIFDGLVIEDFAEGTTASRTWVGDFRGTEALIAFTTDRLAEVEDGFTGRGELPSPVAVVAGRDHARSFHGAQGERAADFLARVRREAGRIGAHWMFFAHTAQVAAAPGTSAADWASSADPLTRALAQGDATGRIIVFRVLSVEPGAEATSAGVAAVLEGEAGRRLGEAVTGDLALPMDAVDSVLTRA